MVILELIHAFNPRLLEGVYLLDKNHPLFRALVNHNNFSDRMAFVLAVLHSNICPINCRW